MKQFNVVIIGFGEVAASVENDEKMGRWIKYAAHMQALRDIQEFKVVAVVDPSEAARQLALNTYQIPIAVSNLQELPVELDYQVAVITTKPDVRLEIVHQLSASVTSLVVEKPLGTNLREIQAFEKLCDEKSLSVQVNLHRRLEAKSLDLKGSWWEAHIGALQYGQLLYGNGLYNNGIHAIDYLRMMCGKVHAVRAVTPKRSFPAPRVSGDVLISAVLEMENSAPVMLAPLDFQKYRDVIVDFWGDKGRFEAYQEGLLFQYYGLSPHRAMDNELEINLDHPTQMQSEIGDALLYIYRNLFDHLNSKAELLSPLHNAVMNHQIIEAIMISSQENRRVEIK